MQNPIVTLRGFVRREWIDYNDHMSEGYYGVVFGDASDGLLKHLGFGPSYRDTTNGTFYTVETRITFEKELTLDTRFEVQTTLIGVDAKRLHVFHELFDHNDARSSTQESLMLHVDQSIGRVAPMGPDLLASARRLREAHAGQAAHDEVGRSIRPVPQG